MFNSIVDTLTMKVADFIKENTGSRMTDKEFLEKEIEKWKLSPERLMQIKGCLYYENEHDILFRKRTMIGGNGELEEVKNLPNNRVIDNQYAKMVNQKANYLLGQPFVIEGKNDRYVEYLKPVFNMRFMRTIKNAGKSALNCGIAWLYPYYDDLGHLSFRMFPGYEILPFWSDSEHTRLEFALRLYLVMGYEGTKEVMIEKVEVYDAQGVHKYILECGKLKPDTDHGQPDCCHVTVTDTDQAVKEFNWSRVPLIPLKYNETETPLLKKVKSLQDGINAILSDFQNNMQEDARNTILVLKNYAGENLGEFRRNLATYGAVKVRYDGETKGGVETLDIKVNAENYKAILEVFKKALIENAMGYDAKDDRLGGNANQMNIKSMYSDIDLDANDMETEFQAAFEEILWFINVHLSNTGVGDYDNEQVGIIFNRDILMNEGEAIQSVNDSVDLSLESRLAQHPWVDDVKLELERLRKQRQEEQEELERQYDPLDQLKTQGGDPDGKKE